MKYPSFLKSGSTIGYVSPAFGSAIEPYKSAFENALKFFEREGIKADIGPNCYKEDGIGRSTNAKDCGAELTDYYCSDKNDFLISCGGGELMCEILDYVDFEKIKKAAPKWFMGYSDNTNFTLLLNTICDTASIYGSCASSFGMEPLDESMTDAYKLMKGEMLYQHGYKLWEKEGVKDEEHPLEPYNLTEKTEYKIYDKNGKAANEASFSGRLIGGCVDCLVNLTGTKYDHVNSFLEKYKDDGIIWFLESCDLNVMAIRRAFWQMEKAGWFKYVKGFIIGRPLCFGQDMMGLDQYEAVMGILRDLNVPVVMDCDFGHLPPRISIISGALAKVDASVNSFTIDYTLA